MVKDRQRLLLKGKCRKLKDSRTFDVNGGACEPSSKIKKRSVAQRELKKRKESPGKKSFKTSIKKKQKKTKKVSENTTMIEQLCHEGHMIEGIYSERLANVDNSENSIQFQTLNEVDSYVDPKADASESRIKTKNLKKDKHKNNSHGINVKESNTEETPKTIDEEKVDEISLVDEDCTRGMKKWLKQYYESRPGLKVLQDRIDEFVTAHEERQEQARKEKEALAAEGGWTVVVHQKGRKKTTEAETGTTVGSAAPASATDLVFKKKNKEIALDFYRFQRREAKMNEVLMLQSRFEQDKKRIQQLRAERKFKPY